MNRYSKKAFYGLLQGVYNKIQQGYPISTEKALDLFKFSLEFGDVWSVGYASTLHQYVQALESKMRSGRLY